VRFWPNVEERPTILGFTGYKAGTTHIFLVEDKSGSPDFGQETLHVATVLETPPMVVCSVRAYVRTNDGLRTFTEAWMKNPPKDLNRAVKLPESFNSELSVKKMDENLDKIAEFRLLTVTQPRQTGVPKKKPDMMEIKIDGGSIKDQFEYVKSLLGKTISVADIFKEGQFIDAVSITKGKGFQGPVKRFGVKILRRKSRKTKRGIACLGPWKPSRILYTVPRAGQMGYSQRTEYNKRILKIGSDGSEVSPKGGFIRYGPVRGTYLLLDGSVAGPTKRLIRLRYPARPPSKVPEAPPKITSISLESPQG
jgi:large subunit ribosomal protein L3